MGRGQTVSRASTVMHVRCAAMVPQDVYRQVLEELAGLSPVVQARPPSAALVELKGAVAYYGVDARRLGEMLRIRAISRLGTDVRVGIGPSITVAATASAQIPEPGGVLAVGPAMSPTGWARCPSGPCTGSARSRRRCCGTTVCTVWACSP